MASNEFYELLNSGTIDGLEPDAIVGSSLVVSGTASIGGALTAASVVAATVSANTLLGDVKSDAVSFGGGTSVTKIVTATATLDFGSIAVAASEDKTITVTGAVTGDAVAFSLPAAIDAGLVFNAFVSAANTVTVRATNVTAAPIDAASAVFRVVAIHF